MKMRTASGKWCIFDGTKNIVFDTARDAWQYIFFQRIIRQSETSISVTVDLHPVRSLIPPMIRGRKKVVFTRL